MTSNKLKIMIDAGHYENFNKSPCKTSPTYYEGNMTWALHLSLVAELKKYGFEVATTRDDIKKDLSVYYRGQKAKGYDMFVSLHSNTPGSSKNIDNVTDRPVIIIPLKHSDELEALAGKLGNAVHELIGTTQLCKGKPYQIYTKKHPQYPERDYYGVLRGAVSVGCKNAMIIEHSFHTCEKTVNFLLKQSNLDKLAAKEAEIIADFFGVRKTEAATPKTEATTLKTEVTSVATFKVGDKYMIKPGDKYTNGISVPSRYIGREMTVIQVKSDGSAIRIKEINSWVVC